MKPLLLLLFFTFLLFSLKLEAQQQWSVADCDKSTQKLHQLEQKISSGYSLKEAQQLNLAQRQLEKQLDQHCQSPTKLNSPRVKTSSPKTTTPDLLAQRAKGPQLYVSSVSVKAPYHGEKLQAWLKYYAEPEACFGVRDNRQMVWCTEQRQQAKANFERQWQQKLALSPPE